MLINVIAPLIEEETAMKNILVMVIVAATLVACTGSKTTVILPSEDKRATTNKPPVRQALSPSEVVVKPSGGTASTRQAELEERMRDLKRQIADLKKLMAAEQAPLKQTGATKKEALNNKNKTNKKPLLPQKDITYAENDPTAAVSPGPSAPVAPIARGRKLQQLLKSHKNLVEIRDEAVVFTVNYGVGKSKFHVPKEMKAALLETAKASQNIEIRGYTDADVDSQAEQEIALARAISAYDFLVQNGIAPNQIYVTYESSGSFSADNSTPKGRARNRRVELEMIGGDVNAF